MRPPGEIRRAAVQTAWELAVERAMSPAPGATSRDIVARLVPQGYGREAVRNTVKNLARCGAFQPVGEVRVSDSMRALVAFAPAQLVAARSAPGAELASALRAWSSPTF